MHLFPSLLDLIIVILLIVATLISISINISFIMIRIFLPKCTCSPPSQYSPWSEPCAPACTQSPALWQQIKDQQKSQKVRKINSMNNMNTEHVDMKPGPSQSVKACVHD